MTPLFLSGNSRRIMRLLAFGFLLLCGCAGGPTKDYYNPSIIGAAFKPPITIAHVDDVRTERERLVSEGYTVIGSTEYGGKYPEAVELKAQAKRVGANRVIYSTVYIPPQPGSWSFSFGRFGGGGGTAGGGYEVAIVFLGKKS